MPLASTQPVQQKPITIDAATTMLVPRASYLVMETRQQDSRLGLVLLSSNDSGERLSLAHTRLAQADLYLRPVSNLVSNRRNIMARVVEDDHRQHDIISGAVFEDYAQLLVAALDADGVPAHQVPDPIRLFCRVTIHDDGRLERLAGGASVGAKFVLFASMSLRIAVVALDGAAEARVHERMPSKLPAQQRR
jgi:uncharacterized protein YcgI (DUF1989 family)